MVRGAWVRQTLGILQPRFSQGFEGTAELKMHQTLQDAARSVVASTMKPHNEPYQSELGSEFEEKDSAVVRHDSDNLRPAAGGHFQRQLSQSPRRVLLGTLGLTSLNKQKWVT